MFKTIGAAVVAAGMAWELFSIGYSTMLAVGVGLPAEQRCERSVLEWAQKVQRDPARGGAGLDEVQQTCQQSAAVVSALVLPSMRP